MEKEKPSCPDHAPYLQDNSKSFQVFVKAKEKSMRIKVRGRTNQTVTGLSCFGYKEAVAYPESSSV